MLLITWMQRYQYRSTEPATSVREDYVHIYRPRRVGLNCKVSYRFIINMVVDHLDAEIPLQKYRTCNFCS
ncbi:hypothetical protein HanXRQr2_Chr08g0354331 [Helianthus annuus]|uniref:Uncharacterized protein n=1 Tax=Helianthus annuus TaxID=4232 RepID=A0A9K3IGU2_HELAN|nr:hypothetical protein HanXRQr2_Chr08g0354331 [Helianthus annuus]KAJ0548308.1 hypothetical protein HanIR_Chr08g0382261 [Helianthus annuus]KAJ0902856.1 hypothetical protein HanPSC8_Chr08g0342151 [Helianthus annuus]